MSKYKISSKELLKQNSRELRELLNQTQLEINNLQSLKAQNTLLQIIPNPHKIVYDTSDANKLKELKKNKARILQILKKLETRTNQQTLNKRP